MRGFYTSLSLHIYINGSKVDDNMNNTIIHRRFLVLLIFFIAATPVSAIDLMMNMGGEGNDQSANQGLVQAREIPPKNNMQILPLAPVPKKEFFVARDFSINRILFDGFGFHSVLRGDYVMGTVSITNKDSHAMTNVAVNVASYDYYFQSKSMINRISPGQTVHARVLFQVPDTVPAGDHLLLVTVHDGGNIRKVAYRTLLVL
jgi:hypothetical protein